ncbi:E3 ubiquitin-protein ligase RNF13 [Termitomyces sp. J132]|nr:E3 ubiquitin-protein ligase RNF13 [Termitomyces sp. J132]
MITAVKFRLAFVITGFLFGCLQILAYVPAQPTNSTQEAIDGGLNVTDISKLYLRWYPNGYYSQNISYQLAGLDTQGTSMVCRLSFIYDICRDSLAQGALVHFSEDKVSNATPPTTTPWIAMVSCDSNATNASQEEDVFTLARDKGAVAALLYSEYSFACVINPEYADPETFDQVFDIFSTQSLTSASIIQYQFGQSGPINETLYGVYDSQRLNDSASMMNTTLRDGTPPAPGYLFAILQAYNSTVQLNDPSTTNGSVDSTSAGGKKQNTNLAMIILYAITGCVSALFCIVIITGAVRAIRHPERYGPRARGRGSLGQSRARGLTHAILDTFPIVKFGRDPMAPRSSSEPESQHIPVKIVDQQSQLSSPNRNQSLTQQSQFESSRPSVASTSLREGSSRGAERDPKDVVPASIGRETCPICIMDFEEGDDLRLLPCEGKHRFHQSCVDPWLLELSSSCPICREDFLALENIISGESTRDSSNGEEHGHAVLPSNSRNRFSRYLRVAKGRHHRRAENGENDSQPSHAS